LGVPFRCPYCGVGCGLLWEGKVKGDPSHPSGRGSLCKKPLYLPKVYSKNRLLRPMKRVGSSFKEISWEEAYGLLEEKFRELKPEETYLYLSGQLTTEDIYAAVKFFKAFLGVNNLDSNSRLCMASAVSAYKMAFGTDGVPCTYEEAEKATAFVFWGSNAAVSHPVLFRRLLKSGGKLAVVDPVRTETAKRAHLYLPLRAGTDAVLANGLLRVLYEEGAIDWEFIEKHAEGFEKALEEALRLSPEEAARTCGVPVKDLYRLARLYAEEERLVTFWCQGINQSEAGVLKSLALINLHLATGRVGERGCPFSLTGQPNAMGGREVGYMSAGLPGYRSAEREEDRAFMEAFWGRKLSPKAGPTVTEAVEEILKGKIKLLWVVGTNPAVSLPDLKKVREALGKVFLVLQEAFWSDTARYADLLLPACPLGEKEGVMTDAGRTLTLSRPFRPPSGECKPDWRIFAELGRRMGAEELFPWRSAEEVFKEFARATEGRLCDLSALSYERLPARWGKPLLYPPFPRKARFYGVSASPPEGEGFLLLTGRLKDQWHTMNRTGPVEELRREGPFVLMNPADAERLNLKEGDRVLLYNELGRAERVVKLGEVREGHLFTPFGYPDAEGVPINFLIKDKKDPISHQPALKEARVFVKKVS